MMSGINNRLDVLRSAKSLVCFVIIITILLFGCNSNNKNNNADNSQTNENWINELELGNEITVGTSTGYEKITTGHKLGLRCLSFYTEKTITVTAYMSQYIRPSEELDGYPLFEVSQITNNMLLTEGRNVKINGEKNKYCKEFTLDDLSYLGTDVRGKDVFEGHSETVVLDFSDYEVGDTASIIFRYGFYYYHNNPHNQLQPDNSMCGQSWSLKFYFGEYGVSVTATTIEAAIREYDNYEEKILEVGRIRYDIPGIFY